MVDSILSLTPVLLLVSYPIYLLLMAAVLAICGVPRRDISKWALKQADRQRLVALIRAARGIARSSDPATARSRAADAQEGPET